MSWEEVTAMKRSVRAARFGADGFRSMEVLRAFIVIDECISSMEGSTGSCKRNDKPTDQMKRSVLLMISCFRLTDLL